MPMLTWIFSLLLVHSAVAQDIDDKEVLPMSDQPGIQVTFRPVYNDGKLKVEYWVVNKTDAPVVIFDRMRNLMTGKPDPNWVFVDISSGMAVLKRAQERMPKNMTMENNPVPYAREIPSGAKVKEHFQLAVPLRQSDPYRQLKGKTLRVVEVERMEFWIGWCPKAELKEAASERRTFGRDRVWIPSYWDVDAVQRIAKSAPIAIRLRALAPK